MKKLILFIILIIPIKVIAISASGYVVMDLDNGRILDKYKENEKRLIASTTKILTSIIAIERGNLKDVIEVSDTIYESFGSSLYLEVGEKITLEDLLYGLMLRSGNDAALLVGDYISGDKESFVYLMNEYASNLNMSNSYFYNPSGLEENNGNGNISTPLDMANLTRYAMNNDIFRNIFKTKNHSVKTNYKSYSWQNKNKLLSLDYITGGKTGYTIKARRTLVTTASKDNINLVIVTLNDPDDWSDHKELYEKIFNNYKNYMIVNKDKIKIKDKKYDKLYINNNIYMTLTKEEYKNMNINYNLFDLDNYYNDELVGYIEISLNEYIYHKEPIYAKKLKKKLTFFEKIKRWLKW